MRCLLGAAVLFLLACQPKLKLVEVPPEEPTPVAESKPPVESLPPSQYPGMEPQPGAPTEPVYQRADWRMLRGLNVKTGEVSPSLKKIEGGVVRIVGYMVPFEDEYETASEFLLVPQAGMCVHLPPPPVNQIILVQMTNGAANVTWSNPVAISGVLEIAQSDSPYGNVSFKMNASSAKAESNDSTY